MREDVRRLLLFVVTLVVGLLMIGIDLPLVQLLPVLVLIGVLLLFATGALTAEDLSRFGERFKRGGKEKKADKGKKSPAVKAQPQKSKEKGGPGLVARLRSSLKDLIPERVPRKPGEKRGGLFSRGEKKEKGALLGRPTGKPSGKAEALKPAQSAAPSPSGGGGTAEDPFMSLSDDELQTDLLDELDEVDLPASEPSDGLSLDMEAVTPQAAEPEVQGADEILSEHASDLEEFTDLEGIEQIDSELASLDDVDLDQIQLSGLDGLEEADLSEAEVPGETQEEAPAPGPQAPEIPQFSMASDSLPEEPKNQEPDMAAFAAGPSSDTDMLSLLASEVKSVKIEADMSILRDLRDVKVSSDELVTDLEGLMQVFGSPEPKGEKQGSKASK